MGGRDPRLHPNDKRWRNGVALSFGGTNEYLGLNAIAPTLNGSDFTVSFWVKGGASGSLRMLFAINEAATYANVFLSRLAGGASNVDFVTGGVIVSGTQHNTTDIIDGAWHHVVWSLTSGGVLDCYVDGVREFSATGVADHPGDDADLVQFGAEWDPGPSVGDYWDGDLAHLAVWTSALDLSTHAPALYGSGAPTDPRVLPLPPRHLWMWSAGWNRAAHDHGKGSATAVLNNMAATDLVASGL